jgi:hypothetical protein
MKVLLTQNLMESTVSCSFVWARVLIGHFLCKYGGSVGLTYSLEVTVCPYEVMKSIAMCELLL